SDRRCEQAVGGEMQPFAADEPGWIELVEPESGRDAAIAQHRPAAVSGRNGDHRAGPVLDLGSDDVDVPALELLYHEPADRIPGPLAHEAGPAAERCHPGRDVGRLAACSHPRAPICVRIFRDRTLEPNDDIEQEIPQGADHPWHSYSVHTERGRRF